MTIRIATELEQGRQELAQALQESYTVTMLVIGGGTEGKAVVEKAEIRAKIYDKGARRVIWIKNPEILDQSQREAYRLTDDPVQVCVLDAQGQFVAHVQRSEAQSLTRLEMAFAKAEQS